MQIRIEASQFPGRSCGPSRDKPEGYHNVHVAVQRRGSPGELLGLVPGDAPSAAWTLDCTATADGTDIKGPCIQGPPGGRFVYLTWGEIAGDGAFVMFRRAKLWLNTIPADVAAQAAGHGTIIARLGLTDAKGAPTCASVRPPLVAWSAEPPAGHEGDHGP
jgi:hypothetical protein